MSLSENTSVKETKTWSRELATVLLLGVGVLAYMGDTDMVQATIWPCVTFALASFGLKQESIKSFMEKK